LAKIQPQNNQKVKKTQFWPNVPGVNGLTWTRDGQIHNNMDEDSNEREGKSWGVVCSTAADKAAWL